MNDAQRAAMTTLRMRHGRRGVDLHGVEGENRAVHVTVYGRITGAEIAAHTIDREGGIDGEPPRGATTLTATP